MSRRRRPVTAGSPAGDSRRRPCPCGSGKRYKNCHGSATDVLVARPFAGRVDECDWVALRELVPAATAPLRMADPAHAGRSVLLATVLPVALPAIVRADGTILVGLQVPVRSGDVSRDIGRALQRALDAEPGTMLSSAELPGAGPRIQELLDPAPLEITVRQDFGFWMDDPELAGAEVQASLERANAAALPTERLASVDAAYWIDAGERAHLRWVLPQEEDAVLDALARLSAVGELGLGQRTRYAGSFRTHGLMAPVWDLPPDVPATEWEAPAKEFAGRLAEALADPAPLTDRQRRARDGIRSRQLTLR